MDCPTCKTPMKSQLLEYSRFHYCMDCGQHCAHEDLSSCCQQPEMIVLQHYITNGSVLRKQCKNCGCLSTMSIKKAAVPNWKDLKFTDPEKAAAYSKKKYDAYSERRTSYMAYFRDQQETLKQKRYREYLASDTWRKKRLMVFSRDKHVCQSCLSKTATQVHHLNYDHFTNEPLFDLISVCTECHESITAMDKGLEFNAITHNHNHIFKAS